MYRTIRNIGFGSVVAFTLIGCGGGSSSSSTSSLAEQSAQGIVELGRVGEATVKIYELNGADKTLKWTEKTSGDETTPLEKIGMFDSHSAEMDADKLYMYEVTGGTDWDVNDDGIKENPENAKLNTGGFRLATKGAWCQATENDAIRVTHVTEMQSRILDEKIQAGTLTEDDITKSVDSLLSAEDNDGDGKPDGDLNGDGKVDAQDILLFEPTKDKKALDEVFIPSLPALLESIHDAKTIPADKKDSDGDGIPDKDEFDGDSDGDGIPNKLDFDDDNDGIATTNEVNDGRDLTRDTDGDGTPNYLDTDDDGDGILTINDEADSDGDGIPDSDEHDGDTDGDGIPDYLDADDDGDGLATLGVKKIPMEMVFLML